MIVMAAMTMKKTRMMIQMELKIQLILAHVGISVKQELAWIWIKMDVLIQQRTMMMITMELKIRQINVDIHRVAWK